MKVQKYLAPNMPEAMKKVRAELGADAVILHSKVVYTGGFLGLFKKRNIEVIAAIDPTIMEKPKVKNKKEAENTLLIKDSKQKYDAAFDYKKEKVTEKGSASSDIPKIMKELDKLNQYVQTINTTNNSIDIPKPINEVLQQLNKHGIDPAIYTDILSELMAKWYSEKSNVSKYEVSKWAKQFLMEEISPFSYGEVSLNKKYINVVGPTGVGKTTTLAKIAGNIILNQQKKVGFITTDTYRIGAIEQLKTYANILSVPLEVCYSIEDYHGAIKKLDYCDVILIDTAGRNFRNKEYVDDLMEVVDFKSEVETLLVLSLTAKQSDLEEIYKQFSSIKINQFVFTKLDETSTYGAMINLIVKCKTGVAYITTGQNVPDDIVPANPAELVNRIIEVD